MKESATEIAFGASASKETGTDLSRRYRQEALKRVMLYLELLDTPALASCDLALKAFRRTCEAAEKDSADRHPVELAMRFLHEALEEMAASGAYVSNREDSLKTICLGPSSPEEHGRPKEIRSMPRLNRGSMVPEEF